MAMTAWSGYSPDRRSGIKLCDLREDGLYLKMSGKLLNDDHFCFFSRGFFNRPISAGRMRKSKGRTIGILTSSPACRFKASRVS
jgi:hypothetical protein